MTSIGLGCTCPEARTGICAHIRAQFLQHAQFSPYMTSAPHPYYPTNNSQQPQPSSSLRSFDFAASAFQPSPATYAPVPPLASSNIAQAVGNPPAPAGHDNFMQGPPNKRTGSTMENTAPPKKKRTTKKDTTASGASGSGAPPPAVYGVGPINPTPATAPASVPSEPAGPAPPRPPPQTPLGRASLPRHKRKPAQQKTAATDVWYHVRALSSKDEPPERPPPDSEPILNAKPKSAYIGCKLCTERWTTWKNVDGMNSTVRHHLVSRHRDIYEAAIQTEGLKKIPTSTPFTPRTRAKTSQRSPFSQNGLVTHIIDYVVSDDQSINVIENPHFRKLLLYIRKELEDSDIPHRTKLTAEILKRCEEENQKMVSELENSLGRVSLTSDIWSDANLSSYMAVTAHYLAKDPNGNLMLCSRLIAFRHIVGTHSGQELAQILLGIVKDNKIANRLGVIALDNASNNNTMMSEMRKGLATLGIDFHEDGNRIRCFPHVVNIAVQTMLKRLTVRPPIPPITRTTTADDDYVTEDPHDIEDTIRTLGDLHSEKAEMYVQALLRDPVSLARKVVKACRASGQRREDLRRVIVEGNAAEWFGEEFLREVELLDDCPTRWSSTYNMIDRFAELYPAIERFLASPKQREIRDCLLSDAEILVLGDIHQVLGIAHNAQEVLSAEKTPTLSMALPTYELMVKKWSDLKEELPELSHVIQAGIDKINEYAQKARKAKIYALAMFLNPSVKLKWMEDHWGPEEVAEAEKAIKAAMLEHRTALRHATRNSATRTGDPPAGSNILSTWKPVLAQSKGLARLRNASTLRRTPSNPTLSPALSSSSSSLPPEEPTSTNSQTRPEFTEADRAAIELAELERDRAAVSREFEQYIGDGLYPQEPPVDLVRYWQAQEKLYPILYRLMLDVLPAQASSVACERVFSSSKETSTARRNRISPGLMESLQLLKYQLKSAELDFASDWMAKEEDFGISAGVSSDRVRELLRAGRVQELTALLGDSSEIEEDDDD